jgi:glycosyltransferase involved in cell wall biosynthesis
MRVAVITPYYKESMEQIGKCHSSVVKQTHGDVTHFLIADGYPRWFNFNCKHISLPDSSRDYGDTPRGIGAAVASAQGYEAIAFLDADNWYEPDHIQTMVGVMKESNYPIITCPRNLFKEDGKFLGVDVESDGYEFNDTNCYLFRRDTFGLLSCWMFKEKEQARVGDRILWGAIKQLDVKVARSTKPTINYTTRLEMHLKYHQA